MTIHLDKAIENADWLKAWRQYKMDRQLVVELLEHANSVKVTGPRGGIKEFELGHKNGLIFAAQYICNKIGHDMYDPISKEVWEHPTCRVCNWQDVSVMILMDGKRYVWYDDKNLILEEDKGV